jgi:Isopropylmalate/homocitrate/citramalate synthases
MSVEQKVEIASMLDEANVFQIEAGIPAMGSLESETIMRIMQTRKNSKISAWNRLRQDDIKKSMDCKPDIIHMSVPVSYVLIYSKLNKNKTWVTKSLVSCVEYALSGGFEVTVGFEDASRADITFMIVLAKQLRELGVKRIRFADTVGVMSPSRTFQAVKDLIENTGIEVEMHAHNDLGMAVANSLVAAKAGSNYIDTTIAGIGERAGNCGFLKFVQATSELFSLGMNTQEAAIVHKRASSILLKQLPQYCF